MCGSGEWLYPRGSHHVAPRNLKGKGKMSVEVSRKWRRKRKGEERVSEVRATRDQMAIIQCYYIMIRLTGDDRSRLAHWVSPRPRCSRLAHLWPCYIYWGTLITNAVSGPKGGRGMANMTEWVGLSQAVNFPIIQRLHGKVGENPN